MLEFKKIELGDTCLLAPFLKNNKYNNCDFSIANIYMWRNKYHTAYAIYKETLILMVDESNFLMPIGNNDLKEVLLEMIAYAKLKEESFKISAVTPTMEAELNMAIPETFQFSEDRKNSDYIYLSSNMIELKGKKLHAKRNHINKFNSLYHMEFEVITDEHVSQVLDLQKKWCLINKCSEDKELLEESSAVQDVISHYKELGLTGGLLKADGLPVAFSFGQPLNDNCFDICIEKADSNVMGAYSMINQQFAQLFCKEHEYINREEDLGIEGLRKAKMSYHPEIILEKDIATLR